MNNLQKEMGIEAISFENISFRQLFALVKKEGLALCSELKLQIKYGSERKEVGSFCETFGIKRIKSPSSINKRKEKGGKKFKKINNEHYYNKKKYKRKFRKNKIVCWKCGRIGRKADKCKLKEKINEICAEEDEQKK